MEPFHITQLLKKRDLTQQLRLNTVLTSDNQLRE